MLVHGTEQAFEAVFEDVFETAQVGCALHTALQAIDLLTQLAVEVTRCRGIVGMAFAGFVQVALE
ncbi:hypothetical protein D3C80_1114270 [compost metagenome]